MSPWHAITVPDAPPKIAANLTGLGAGQYDGHVGIVRIGAYPDIQEEQFIWDGTVDKWIGTTEHVVLSALDGWAMDWSKQPLSRLRNKWSRPAAGVGWQQSGPGGTLIADLVLPVATFTVERNSNQHFDIAGQVLIKDVLITYTGSSEPNAGQTTFTGCTNDSGQNGRTFDALHTAVAPFAAINGGDPGGWGTAVTLLDRVGEMWAAGFRLQERIDGFFNGTTDLTAVEFAPFYLNKNLNEDLGAGGNYPGSDKTADQIPGILGPGVTVTGPAYDMSNYTAPGLHKPHQERGFERRTSAWVDWVAAAPTKRFLQPILYARHVLAAKGSGECYSLNLSLRWVSS